MLDLIVSIINPKRRANEEEVDLFVDDTQHWLAVHYRQENSRDITDNKNRDR